MSDSLSLNPQEDSFIVIKFAGMQSASFNLYPNNVSPAQMLMIAEMLKYQAVSRMNEIAMQRAEAEREDDTNKILVPKPNIFQK